MDKVKPVYPQFNFVEPGYNDKSTMIQEINGLGAIRQQALTWTNVCHHIDGLMQKRYNSSELAMELSLFCIKPSIWYH